jgi:hypothetical protein
VLGSKREHIRHFLLGFFARVGAAGSFPLIVGAKHVRNGFVMRHPEERSNARQTPSGCRCRSTAIRRRPRSSFRGRYKFGPHLLALVLIGVPYICNAQTPADDVAAQIRSQGYRCDQPVTAKRDLSRSKPDSAVWVLNCRNATFRVRLDPNMAARINKLKSKS